MSYSNHFLNIEVICFLSWSHGLFFAWHFRNNGQKSLDFAMEFGKKSLWVMYDMGIDFDSVYTNLEPQTTI